jgi:hypothetical protein
MIIDAVRKAVGPAFRLRSGSALGVFYERRIHISYGVKIAKALDGRSI